MTSGRGAVQTCVSQRGCAIRQLHTVCSMSQTIWLRNWIVACRRTLIISCGSLMQLFSCATKNCMWARSLIILGEEHTLWSSSLCSFLQPPTTSSLFGPNILLSILFSNTLSEHLSTLCKRPHAYTTGNIDTVGTTMQGRSNNRRI
jgi:hypothetical protein